MTETSCPLCQARNENILWRDALLRVIRVDDPDYPGFCRVILNRHVKEMTDLPPDERARYLSAVRTATGPTLILTRWPVAASLAPKRWPRAREPSRGSAACPRTSCQRPPSPAICCWVR